MLSRTLIYLMSTLSVIYALMAHVTAHSASRDTKRTLATLTMVSLSIWALSYAVSFASPNAQEGLLWRKLGVLGWGTVYSFLLHFVILITQSLQQKRHRPLLALIYLPAVVNLVFFLFLPVFADRQYHMVYQEGLWLNHWVDTPFNWGYIAYSLLSILLSMGLLLAWAKKSKLAVEKKQALAIFLALLVVLVIALAANQLLQQLFDTQLTSIFIVITALFPALTVSYHVRRHSLFFAQAEQPDQLQPQILSGKVRSLIYRVGGLALFLFSFLVFYSVTIDRTLTMPLLSRLGVAAAGLLFMVFAQVLCSLKNSKLSIKQQELVFFVIFVIFDILLFLRYLNSGGVTVWAAILLLIIASTIFDNIWMVTLGTGIHILLMVYMALRNPNLMAEVSLVDHVWRILIVGAAMGLAYAVNRIYRKRLLDNIAFAKLQASISQVALLMARGEQAAYQRTLSEVMAVANRFLYPDSIQLLSNPREEGPAQANPPLRDHLSMPRGEIDTSQLEQLLSDLLHSASNEEYCILTTNLPDHANPCQETLLSKGIDKLLITPLKTGYGSFSLVLAIHQQARAQEQHWRNHLYVSMLASYLNNYIQRTGSERALEQLAFTDQLTRLYKRDRFLDLAEQQLQQENPEGLVHGLLFIDLNGFKTINDQAGHQAGDLALKMVADAINSVCSPEDLVGRFGGDEFLVFASRRTEAMFLALEHQLNEALTFDYQHGALDYPLSAAIGAAYVSAHTASIWQLLEMADRAMYQTKASCRKGKLEPR